MRRSLVFSLLWLAACETDAPGKPSTPDPEDTDTDAVVLPGPVDTSWMDELPASMLEVPEHTHGGLDITFDRDARDAVTAYAGCGGWISDCLVEKSGDFAACVAAAPVCQTEAPWEEGECCPAACRTRFDTKVAEGAPAYDAYVDTYALDRTCFPGLTGGAR